MGLKELFYNPYTKQEGKFGIEGGQLQSGLQKANHDNHLHVASDNSDEMKEIMNVAHDEYGLTVHENPYATEKGWDPDGVQPVHAKNGYHYITLGSGNVGGAADITGDQQIIFNFIDNYLYEKVYPKKTNPSSGGSLNKDLVSKSKIDTDDGNEKFKTDRGSRSVSFISSNDEWSPENVLSRVKRALTTMGENKENTENLISEEISRIKNLMK